MDKLISILLGLLILPFPAVADDQAAETQKNSFGAYHPNYILYSQHGGEDSSCDIKFQLSLKQQLALPAREDKQESEEGSEDAQTLGESAYTLANTYIFKHLFFAYTQRSFWDICRDSAPFRETVFSPEGFLSKDYALDKFRERPGVSHIQAGYQHESNGKDGSDSRSWDRLYGEIEFAYLEPFASIFGVNGSNVIENVPGISLSLRAWYIAKTGQENRDIEDYLGHMKVDFKISTRAEQLALSSWVGDKGKTSVEANVISKTTPYLNKLPFFGEIFPSRDNSYFWLFQYFNGYGDELIEYNHREKVFRLGLLFSY